MSLLAHIGQGLGANGGTTSSIDTTGANFIQVVVGSYAGATAPVLTDSKSNTWGSPILTQNTGGSGVRHEVYTCEAPTVGSGHTFTLTGSGTYCSLIAAAFDGITTSALDQSISPPATGSAVQTLATGSITPGQDSELVLASLSIDALSSGVSVNSSLSLIDSVDLSSGNYYGCYLAYIVQGTAGAINPTFSWTGVGNAVAAIESFKTGLSVIVTPATDLSGTFTPTSVTLTEASPSATFTFTPTVTGTHHISITNDGGLTDPSALDYVVTSGVAPQDAYPVADIADGSWQAAGPEAIRNLLTYTEAFDNAAYTKTNCTITANGATDPQGRTEADVLVETGAGSTSHGFTYTFSASDIVPSVSHTFSVYVQNNGRDRVYIEIKDKAGTIHGVFFDVSTGSILSGTGGVIAAAGNGYYRCSVTANVASGGGAVVLLLLPADNSNFVNYVAVGNALSLWGAQFEQASSVTAYQPILTTGAANEPVTNLFHYTEDFSNAFWTKVHCSIPSGVTLVEDGTNNQHFITIDSTSGLPEFYIGLPYTIFFDITPNGRDWCYIRFITAGSATNCDAYYNVSAGTLGTVGSGASASITPRGGGVYRCSLTRVSSGGVNTPRIDLSSATADGVNSYTGSGAAALDITHAQLQQAVSPGDYQPILVTTTPLALTVTTPIYPYVADGGTGTADDTTYAFTNTSSDTAKLLFGALPDPATGSGHKLKFRAYNVTGAQTLDVYLHCGATLIASTSAVLGTSAADYEYDLNSSEANSITDYTNMRLWLVSPSSLTSEVRVTWAQFETPGGAVSVDVYVDSIFFGSAM